MYPELEFHVYKLSDNTYQVESKDSNGWVKSVWITDSLTKANAVAEYLTSVEREKASRVTTAEVN